MSASEKPFVPGSSGLQIEVAGKLRQLELSRGQGNAWLATLDGESFPIDAKLIQPGVLSLILDDRSYRCVLNEGPVETAIHVGSESYLVAIDDPRSLATTRRKRGASSGQQVIKAPMPGRIVRLLVTVGDLVEAHQAVVVIEAMKMQNELKATRAGKVVEIKIHADTIVAAGAVLVIID